MKKSINAVNKSTGVLLSLALLLNFGKYSIGALSEIADYIVLCMSKNIYFLTPTPSVEDIQALLTDYKVAATAAKSRDRDAIAARTAARTKLIAGLIKLGRWVMANATDDQQVISSGFPISKRGQQPVPHIPVATNFTVADGPVPYSIKASVDGSALIKIFTFQMTDAQPTKETIWVSEPSTVKEYVFENLTPEKRYWFRVILGGTKGQRQYSGVLSRLVQ